MISENNQQNSLSDVTYPLYENGYSYTGVNGNIRDRLPVFDDILSLKWQRSLADRNGDTRKLLPLWIADMDFETVPTVKEALQKRISTGIYGYSYIPESYKEAVADWFKNRFHHSLLSREIIPFTGVIPAINAAIYAFTRPRANVLLQTPVSEAYTCLTDPAQLQLVKAMTDSCCMQYGAKKRDYSCDNRFQDTDFFDSDHLSDQGARKFSAILARDLCR